MSFWASWQCVEIQRAEWWTEADAAEWKVLANELVQGVLEHREHCSVCQPGAVCSGMARAWEISGNWLRSRGLLSRAEHLRRLQKAA